MSGVTSFEDSYSNLTLLIAKKEYLGRIRQRLL